MSTEYANIGARGVRSRAISGVVALVAGLALAVWLVVADIDRPWRLALLPLFYFAGLALFQAWCKV